MLVEKTPFVPGVPLTMTAGLFYSVGCNRVERACQSLDNGVLAIQDDRSAVDFEFWP